MTVFPDRGIGHDSYETGQNQDGKSKRLGPGRQFCDPGSRTRRDRG